MKTDQVLMNYSIRPARIDDVKDFHELMCELEDRQFEPLAFSAVYQSCLDNKENIYLVAETGSLVIGILTCHGQVLLHHTGTVYEIQELIVRDAYRSRGVGEALVNELEKQLEGKDHEMLEVASNLKRTRAHSFYLELGFRQSHYKFTKPH